MQIARGITYTSGRIKIMETMNQRNVEHRKDIKHINGCPHAQEKSNGFSHAVPAQLIAGSHYNLGSKWRNTRSLICISPGMDVASRSPDIWAKRAIVLGATSTMIHEELSNSADRFLGMHFNHG